MEAEQERKADLLQREAEFWDRHEDSIEQLYKRPHDWRLAPEIAMELGGRRSPIC